MADDNYINPRGWTCFHCGETFNTLGTARDHFGAQETANPGCVERVRLGAERGLLHSPRETEARLAVYIGEDCETQRAMARMQNRHAEALRAAEESGYERGLRDAENRHQAIEIPAFLKTY